MRNILVVDGNSIINRAFYGIKLLQAQNGKYTNAIYGMVNIIWRVMESVSPDYAAVAFDVKAPTFRHKMYDAYKAGRHATPEELLSQFPDAKEMLSALGLSVLELPGWEADDIQGTVARFADANEDMHAYILSGDKDLLQLVSPNITVILAGNKEQEHYDETKFFEKYGVKPSQFVDVKALMGDHSDNIPGVPGIGEVSALKLIAAFGSVDGIYDALNREDLTKEEEKLFSPSVRRKLTEGKESAYLSQTLARISCEAPIKKTLDDIAYKGIQKGALYRKCIELEFSAFLRKFGVTQADAAEEAMQTKASAYTDEAQAISDSMTVVQDDSFFDLPAKNSRLDELKNTVNEAKIAKTLSQKEATGTLTDAFSVAVVENALQFYAPACGAFAVEESEDLSLLQPLFDGQKEVHCYDSKALWHFLKKKGVTLGGVPKDVMLAGYVARGGDGKVTLSALSLAYLELDLNEQTCLPALIWALSEVLQAEAEKNGVLHLLCDMEWPLAMVLAEMEDTGFKLDVAGMEAYGAELKAEADALAQEIHELAGEPFNINSPKQLGEVLFTKLGLPTQKKTKSGYSTDAETLEKLREAHPIVDAILAYRQVTKLYTTYALGLVAAADNNGRIHTDFKQALTATGRLSSAEPNLQNIPVRTKAGEKMRTYFIADEGNVLVDADYSQIELRLLAELSCDENMISAFKAGEDIHRQTASKVFGVPVEGVTDQLRKRAKAVNFGIVYGIGAHSLSQDLGVPQKQAKAYIESYLASYAQIDAFLKKTVEDAEADGYTVTYFGRKRNIPELKSTKMMVKALGKRIAMNSPIQGTAADVMKLAMLKVYRRLKAAVSEAKLVMQVHDELIVECPKTAAQKVADILSNEMRSVVDFNVPLLAEAAFADNWLDAKS